MHCISFILTKYAIIIRYNKDGDNMLKQIGIIFICSGMILAFMSTSQYHFIIKELWTLCRSQWPFVLIFFGFYCMMIGAKTNKKERIHKK